MQVRELLDRGKNWFKRKFCRSSEEVYGLFVADEFIYYVRLKRCFDNAELILAEKIHCLGSYQEEEYFWLDVFQSFAAKLAKNGEPFLPVQIFLPAESVFTMEKERVAPNIPAADLQQGFYWELVAAGIYADNRFQFIARKKEGYSDAFMLTAMSEQEAGTIAEAAAKAGILLAGITAGRAVLTKETDKFCYAGREIKCRMTADLMYGGWDEAIIAAVERMFFPQYNLLPYVRRPSAIEWSKVRKLVLAAVLFFCLGTYGYLLNETAAAERKIQRQHEAIKSYQKTEEKLAEIEKDRSDSRTREEVLAGLTAKRTSWHSILTELGCCKGEGISLTGAASSAEAGIKINGQADDYEKLHSYVAQLAAKNYGNLQNAVLLSSEKNKNGTIDFSMEVAKVGNGNNAAEKNKTEK